MPIRSMTYAGKLKAMKERGKGRTQGRRSKWKNQYYVLAYIWAKEYKADKRVAERLGINYHTFRDWVRIRPTLQWALAEARKPESTGSTTGNVLEYISGRLPKKLQKLYKKICSRPHKRSTAEELMTTLRNLNDKERKRLFLHAYVSSNFVRSTACKKIGITYTTLQKWCQDKQFQELMECVQEEMKDFFESSLVRLIKEGDAQATIFANKTKNRDRGYGEKVEMVHSGQVNHRHMVQVDLTKLSLKARKEVFELMENQEKQKEKLEELQMRDAGQTLMIPDGRKK